MTSDYLKEKISGCLWGQAIGDALGLGSEFMSKEEVKEFYPQGLSRYDQIVQDSHRSRWKTGAWTDDTDMMLCILDGYIEGKFNLHAIAQNFKDWFNGDCLGIGRHTNNVLSFSDYVENPMFAAEVIWKLYRCRSAANGGIMRTSVVGIPENITDKEIEDVCRLTHPDSRCIGSCVIASIIIHNLIWHQYELSLSEIKEIGAKYSEEINKWVDLAYSGELSDLHLDDNASMGYTLRTLAAALWVYFHSPDFESGLRAIVNEGGDADTNGAIACAVLGAKYGIGSIPQYYINDLNKSEWYGKKVNEFIDSVLSY